MSRRNVFFLIVTAFVSLHVWADFVLTRGMPGIERTMLFVVDAIGFCLTLSAIFLDLPKINAAFAPLDWMGYAWLGVFAWMVTSAVFVEVVRLGILPLVTWFAGWAARPAVPPGLGLDLVGLLTVWSLFEGIRFPRITRYRRHFLGRGKGMVEVPSVDEKGAALRVIQLSDLHIGMLHLRKERLAGIVAAVNGQDPDIVVITGDLVEANLPEVSDDLEPLRDVRAKRGRYYVTGNHEYYYGGAIWERLLESYGWTILHSRSAVVDFNGQQIQVVGVPDLTARHADPRASINYDTGQGIYADLKIFLVHQPSEIRFLKEERPDVVLTGHTHGGQLWPFRPFVRLVQPVVSGWKRVHGMDLFVHRGTGFWGPPMRLGAPAEIAVIDIEFVSSS